jgi:uncharacterized protein (DUF3084 family)
MNSDFTPPHSPSAQTIESVFALLQAVSDPAAVKSRIAALVEQTKAVNDACAELAAERKRLTDENARALDLRQKEVLLANKESDLTKAATAQAVSASALQDRDRKAGQREAAAEKRHAEIDAREKALEAKLAGYREGLA